VRGRRGRLTAPRGLARVGGCSAADFLPLSAEAGPATPAGFFQGAGAAKGADNRPEATTSLVLGDRHGDWLSLRLGRAYAEQGPKWGVTASTKAPYRPHLKYQTQGAIRPIGPRCPGILASRKKGLMPSWVDASASNESARLAQPGRRTRRPTKKVSFLTRKNDKGRRAEADATPADAEPAPAGRSPDAAAKPDDKLVEPGIVRRTMPPTHMQNAPSDHRAEKELPRSPTAFL